MVSSPAVTGRRAEGLGSTRFNGRRSRKDFWESFYFLNEVRIKAINRMRRWEKVLEIEDKVEYVKEASQEWSSGRTRETGLMGSFEQVDICVRTLRKTVPTVWFFPPPYSSAKVQRQSP